MGGGEVVFSLHLCQPVSSKEKGQRGVPETAMCVFGRRGVRKVEGEGLSAAPALTPACQAPTPVPAPPLLGFSPFRSSGAGISTHGGDVRSTRLGRGNLGLSLTLSSDYLLLPLDWTGFGKVKLQQETEYLFGLDGAGLAVNQKFSLTSSRKKTAGYSPPA